MKIEQYEDPQATARQLLVDVLRGYHPWCARKNDDEYCAGGWATVQIDGGEWVWVQVPDEALESLIDFVATMAGYMRREGQTITYSGPSATSIEQHKDESNPQYYQRMRDNEPK